MTRTIRKHGAGDMDWEFSSADGQEEEVLASNEGSAEDRRFDSIVGSLEEAVMDPKFAAMQQSFVDRWCGEFDGVEENKLIYTDLFGQYTQLVEQHLGGWLEERIRGFDMEAFMRTVAKRQDEIVGDVFDILLAVGDFDEFKGMMLAHRNGLDNGLGAEEEAKGAGLECGSSAGSILRVRRAGVPVRGASSMGGATDGEGRGRRGTSESKW